MLSGMSPLFFSFVLPLLVLGLLGYGISSLIGWFKDRHLRKELKKRGVYCDHLRGPDLQLFHAEQGLNMIKNAQREIV